MRARLLLGNGAAAVIDTPDLTIMFDPGDSFTVDMVKREFGKVDLLLMTHEHSDHYNPDFLRPLVEEFDPYLIVNKGVFRLVKRWVNWDKLIKLKDGEMIPVAGAKVHALRAVHPGIHPLAYLVELGNVAIFHGDSTGYSSKFEAFSPVNLAFIPVGFPSPTSSPSDAVRLVRALIPDKVVPIHGESEEVQEFIEKLGLSGYSSEVIGAERGVAIDLEL